MVFLMWGWVHQRIALRFRPTIWKKRYLVLTTMSIHIHKSEKGVISSLFPDNLPIVHVWSNFRSVKSYKSRSCSKSAQHTFLMEPRDPKLYPLKFKCATLEEKEKWLEAIGEQLSLTSKIWSHNISTIVSTTAAIKSNNKKSTSHHHAQFRYASEKPIISVSVLDKWLDQIQIVETQNMFRKEQQQQQETKDVDYYCSGLSLSSPIRKRKSSSSPLQSSSRKSTSSQRNSANLKKRSQKIIPRFE